MIYGSVCSGIEAATVAWHPLGWKPAFFSEIDKFPRQVLAHHYPDVPCHGDFLTIKGNEYGAIDLLVGGTPCQSFSVAGLRKGMDDPRGNLALGFLGLLARTRPRWVVWENVPGVLSSSGGRDFGAFLGALGELGYGWAYRVLDAQYFGVAQRRRRVFVVGCAGDWRPAAAVLFERESLCGDPAPRRETGEGVANTVTQGTRNCDRGEKSNLIGSHWDGGPHPSLSQSHNTGGIGQSNQEIFSQRGAGLVPAQARPAQVAPTLNAAFGKKQGLEDQHVNQGCPLFVPAVAQTLRGEGFDASEDGTGRQNLVRVIAGTMKAGKGSGGFSNSADHAATGYIIPVAFSCKDNGRDAQNDIAPTHVRSMGHNGSHPNGGGQLAVAIQERAVCENPDAGPDGVGVRSDGLAYTLEARPVPQAVAYPINTQIAMRHEKLGEGTGLGIGKDGDPAFTIQAAHHHAVFTSAVRRLTPRECERLQGFPDDYTLIPINNKGGVSADGPRYKALGNSMAVPVMVWIGKRIQTVEDLERDH